MSLISIVSNRAHPRRGYFFGVAFASGGRSFAAMSAYSRIFSCQIAPSSFTFSGIVAAGREAAWELYDLTTDRSEEKNLAAKMPDKVKELGAIWQDKMREYADLAAKDLAPEAKATPKK